MVGKIVISEYVSHEDGGATVSFECDEKAKSLLVEEGLNSLINKLLDETNAEYEIDKE